MGVNTIHHFFYSSFRFKGREKYHETNKEERDSYRAIVARRVTRVL